MAPTGEDIACRQLVEVVSDYLEDELSPARLHQVEEHLLMCAGCEAYVAQMRATVQALRRVETGGGAPERRREFLDAFRAWAG